MERKRLPNKKPTKAEREKSIVVSEKHQAFANAIMEGHSQSDAARAAGYHPVNATNVMRQEEVQLALMEARREVQNLTTVKRLDVLNIFLEAVDMARTLADPAQMINGAKEIGKMLGYYEPEKLDISVSMDTHVLASKMRAMSDAELYELAAKKAAVVEGEVVQ